MKIRKLVPLGLGVLLAVGLAIFQKSDVDAASLATRVALNLSANLSGTAGLVSATAPLSIARTIDLANGVAASQADQVYTTTQSIAGAGNLTLDVKGALVDAFGAAFTPAKLKVVYIYSSPTNTTTLTLFGDAAHVPILNTVATTTTLLPGGLFLMVEPPLAGIAVTATTADLVKITNAAGAAATVDVVLIGTSS